MPFDVVNRRNPGTLCQSEVVYEDGIAHIHAIKGVAAQGRHFNPRRGRINGKCRVQHGGSPKVGSFVYRHGAANLEGWPSYLSRPRKTELFTPVTFKLRELQLISSYSIIKYVKNVMADTRCGFKALPSASRFKGLCRNTRMTVPMKLPPNFAHMLSSALLTGLVRGT